MKNKKLSLIISILVVLIVIAVLVFITINKKGAPLPTDEQQVAEEQNTNTNMENTNTQNVDGVKITILKEGTGDQVAKAGDTVSMGYIGVLADGTVFDSNVDQSTGQVKPFDFTLGAGQVIQGWDIGVAGMKIEEQRKLEIPAALAYGANGAGSVIPPNADLTFVVQLISIK